ncbi:MAG: hypothetical protein H7Z42_00835 [Roseiflexaceae bacterium]|nr:hypothetical protein [Roseiflexaceae bacterium]
MELRKYWGIAAAYRWPLILAPLIAALVALGATYVVSQKFVGIATVQLIPEEIEPRTVTLRAQNGPDALAIGLKDPTELLAQGVVESLGSHEVAELVADDLELKDLPPPSGFAALKSQVRGLLDDLWAFARFGYVAKKPNADAAVDRVSQAIDAELVRGSYYVQIYAAWNDPQTASSMANAAVDAVLVHSRAVAAKSAQEQRVFLEAQRAVARRQVDTARAAVLQYSAANSIVTGDSLRSAVIALEQSRVDLRQNELTLIDARQRLALARQQLESTSANLVSESTTVGASAPSSGSTTRTTSPNLVYQSLEERIAILAQEVVALESRQNQTASEVGAQTELALVDARQRLATAEQQLGQPDLTELVRDQLKTQAFALQQEIAALEARRNAANASQQTQHDIALVEARRKLDEARQQIAATSPTVDSVQQTVVRGASQNGQQTSSTPNPVYQSLLRDVQIQEQAIAALEPQQLGLQNALTTREQELRALTVSDGRLTALNQELGLSNDSYTQRTSEWYSALLEESRPVTPIRLIDPAVVPLYPVAPIKLYWALIGAAAGLAAALIYVFVRYSTDVSLRSASEAEEALTMPLLAVIPLPRRERASLPRGGPGRGGMP